MYSTLTHSQHLVEDELNSELKFGSCTRTRTNTIPNDTKANAAGLSGCACVRHNGSDDKGGSIWQTQKHKAFG